tara:strand:- start:20198 stop:20488 length:291 start_codon:yes stop_codon:yes gene_type:complete
MILEVDKFTTLEELASDIKDVTTNYPNTFFTENHPLTVELDQENFTKLENKLRSHGTYGGIRHIDELMLNKWNVNGTYITYQIKKEEKEEKEDGAI